MAEDLKPCPFICESEDVKLIGNGGTIFPVWWVACHTCVTEGPTASSPEEAITKWNTRAADAEIERLREALATARRDALKEAAEMLRDVKYGLREPPLFDLAADLVEEMAGVNDE